MTVKLNYATIEIVNALIDKGIERKQAEAFLQEMSNRVHDNVYSVKEIDKMMADTVKEVFKKNDANFEAFRKEQRREFDSVLKKHKKDAWVVAGTLGSTMLVGFISVAIAIFFGLK